MRLLAVAALAACSTAATLAFAAKQEGGAAGVMSGSPGPRGRSRPPVVHGPETTCAGTLNSAKAWSDSGRVFVTAKATLYDAGTSYKYMWGLTVVNLNTGEASVRHYSDEAFAVEPGATVKRSFDRSFLMEPGAYAVRPALFRVPGEVADFDLNLLKADNTSNGLKLLEGYAEVVVKE